MAFIWQVAKIKVGEIEVEKYFCKQFLKSSLSYRAFTYATINKKNKTGRT